MSTQVIMQPGTGKGEKGVSLISWVNNKEQYEHFLLPSLYYGLQLEAYDLECIVVTPNAKCRNMGQAYNLARPHATHATRIYAHQDVSVRDRSYLSKLEIMLDDPDIGLVGITGSTVDTGACFYHADNEDISGMNNRMWWPQTQQVKIVDCFLFATRLDIPFSEEYEKSHMVAEDYCMRVRAAGKQIWTVDSQCEHLSGGKEDASFWRSVAQFRRTWREALPKKMKSRKALKDSLSLLQFETNVEFVVL